MVYTRLCSDFCEMDNDKMPIYLRGADMRITWDNAGEVLSLGHTEHLANIRFDQMIQPSRRLTGNTPYSYKPWLKTSSKGHGKPTAKASSWPVRNFSKITNFIHRQGFIQTPQGRQKGRNTYKNSISCISNQENANWNQKEVPSCSSSDC